jgi:hypothetical protein
VTIDSNGVGWKCFHCGWRGGAFYDGRRTRCRASGRTGVAPAVPRTALKKTASQDEAQVTNGVVIGEGVETTLAAATRIQHRGTLLTPAWATGDAGHLEKFPVLPGIEALTVLVDHDENGRGQRATADCARRWTAAGRDVIQLIPRIPGEDFADLVGVSP